MHLLGSLEAWILQVKAWSLQTVVVNRPMNLCGIQFRLRDSVIHTHQGGGGDSVFVQYKTEQELFSLDAIRRLKRGSPFF